MAEGVYEAISAGAEGVGVGCAIARGAEADAKSVAPGEGGGKTFAVLEVVTWHGKAKWIRRRRYARRYARIER